MKAQWQNFMIKYSAKIRFYSNKFRKKKNHQSMIIIEIQLKLTQLRSGRVCGRGGGVGEREIEWDSIKL